MQRPPFPWGVRDQQDEQDAALPLQLIRARHVNRIQRHGHSPGAELVSGGMRSMRAHLDKAAYDATELLAVSVPSLYSDFIPGHEYNRYIVRRGIRMLSLYNAFEIDATVRQTIVGATGMPYHLACGRVQMKVFDRKCVVVEGPLVDGERSLLLMTDRDAVVASLQYVAAVRSTAVRAETVRAAAERLTSRQRDIAELLEEGLRDQDIAARLGLSLRTVRSDVAALMHQLDAPTRFAAGARYAERKQEGDPH